MARVPYIDGSTLPPDLRPQLSSNANIVKALSNSPRVAITSGDVARYIRHGNKLDPRLREMAIIQVGYAAKSAYEYAHHIKIGHDFGVTDDDVRAIADESAGRKTGLDPLTKAALRAAREMTHGIAILDETFAELKQHLSDELIVELVFAIATYAGVVRMLASLQVDLEDEYKEYLVKFPLPR
jgi:alkylhydroperoxidase family enzyme